MQVSVHKALLVLCLTIGGTAAALAQGEVRTTPFDGALLAQDQRPAQPERSPSASPLPDQPGSTSGTLSRSKGVLPPPNVGDQIAKSPPDQGEASTPVIPPPGTPNGPHTVDPK